MQQRNAQTLITNWKKCMKFVNLPQSQRTEGECIWYFCFIVYMFIHAHVGWCIWKQYNKVIRMRGKIVCYCQHSELEDLKVMVSIEHKCALAVSITSCYWDFSNRKNTPFSLTVTVFGDMRVGPSKQAVLFRCQVLLIAAFDHHTGCGSHEDLWQKISRYCMSIFGWVLYGKSTRQWVWHLLVNGEESIWTLSSHEAPWISSFCLEASVAMFPKQLMRHWVVLLVRESTCYIPWVQVWLHMLLSAKRKTVSLLSSDQ